MPTFIFLNTESIQSLLQPFLESQDYFDLKRNEATQFVVNCQSLSGIMKVILIFASGYMYDIFGRKSIIFFCFTSLGLLLIFIPYTAPNLGSLEALYVTWGIMVEPLMLSPIM